MGGALILCKKMLHFSISECSAQKLRKLFPLIRQPFVYLVSVIVSVLFAYWAKYFIQMFEHPYDVTLLPFMGFPSHVVISAAVINADFRFLA